MNITNTFIGKIGIGVDISDLFGLSVGVMSDEDMLYVGDISINFNTDNQADAHTTLSYTDNLMSGENTYEDVCFVMTKEGFSWFIQDITSIQ